MPTGPFAHGRDRARSGGAIDQSINRAHLFLSIATPDGFHNRFDIPLRRIATLETSARESLGDGMKTRMLLALLLAPALVLAQDCPNAENLVTNCGLDSSTAGYTPQDPGDTIAHVSNVGATALGAMRVTDTVADGNTEAEAETCINTGPGIYRIAASFKAITASNCFVGFDEHVQPNCAAPNGNFVSGPAVAVNNQTFTRIQSEASVGTAVVSVELVVICGDGVSAQFDVDDITMIRTAMFRDGFE